MMNRFMIIALVFSVAGEALAIPPDRIVYLKVGESRFEPGPQGHWLAEAIDPTVVKAEAFDTKEVFLTGQKAGQTLLLLNNKSLRETLFWKVLVGQQHRPDLTFDSSPVGQACKCDMDTHPLQCQVSDKNCILALRRWISDGNMLPDKLHLNYSSQSLQLVLREMDKRLTDSGLTGISLVFVGVNLRVTGTVADRAAWRKLMQILYESMLGRLLLEDQIKILDRSTGIEPPR